MAELPFQTYARIFGRNWPGGTSAEIRGYLRTLGITAPPGSAAANVAFQKALIGGWRPGQAAAPAPATRPAPRPAPRPPPSPPASLAVPVQPGLQAEQFADRLALEKLIADQLAQLERSRIALQEQRDADARRLTEAQLGANPADFVAFELFKRSLEEQGFTPTNAPRSDVEIQDLFSLALNLEGLGDEGILGAGQFGVDLPTTQSISRSELGAFNPTDIGILSSFLRGGVETDGGEFQGINPEDFFTELEEGLVPVLPQQRTQFRF
ncbi:hypothetical protein LCGC14_1075290 [marine sediment metagenome]|uniref:Uncharacterized protein n=1 Tax=marine sediment metagenome TaxID=412755 RepID=A0A0F9MGT0_9ZZZZ